MGSNENVYQLIDISLESEDEDMPERVSMPLPKNFQSNYRIVLQISHSSVEAVAYEKT